MWWKVLLKIIGCSLAAGGLAGCIVMPNAVPYVPLRADIKAVDKETHAALADVRVVLYAQRLEGYLPDGKPGKEKAPSVIVDRLEQSSRITLTDREVYFFPFFAIGTVYGRKAAWIFRAGYIPVVYPWGSEAGVPIAVELVPCDIETSRKNLIDLVSSEVADDRWKADAVASLRSQLK